MMISSKSEMEIQKETFAFFWLYWTHFGYWIHYHHLHLNYVSGFVIRNNVSSAPIGCIVNGTTLVFYLFVVSNKIELKSMDNFWGPLRPSSGAPYSRNSNFSIFWYGDPSRKAFKGATDVKIVFFSHNWWDLVIYLDAIRRLGSRQRKPFSGQRWPFSLNFKSFYEPVDKIVFFLLFPAPNMFLRTQKSKNDCI